MLRSRKAASAAILAVAALALAPVGAACSRSGGGSSSGGGAGSAAAGGAATSPSQPPAPGPSQADQLAAMVREQEARRQRYLEISAYGFAAPGSQTPAAPPVGQATPGESVHSQIARLELGGPLVARGPIDADMDFVDRRPDTADFRLTKLLRLAYRFGNDPRLPQDLRDRLARTIQGFRYFPDEPGQDQMIMWSENHQIMFFGGAYLAGHLYPAETFTSSGLTGAQLAQKARPFVLRWLEHRFVLGFSEWCSPVYYPHDFSPLMNLVDFAPEPEVHVRAAMVADLLLFDVARLSNRGSFGVSAGRVYVEHKISGRAQSIGDLAEVLFGQRESFRGRGSTGGTAYVVSTRYRAPQVLLAIGQDKPERFVDRSRVGTSFAEASRFGIGFSTLDDGLVWWGMGAYAAPETILLSRRMLDAWGLWHQSQFSFLSPVRGIPDALLPAISSTLSPISEGSALTEASLYTYRTPDAMLSSVQDYRRGQVGFQQHAWQATLDLDAAVFTTQPGNLGRDGPDYWTGSGSLPRIVQQDGALLALYNPGLAQRAMFPAMTHAFFPRAAFDAVVERQGWVFGKKGDGYVALWSSEPVTWQQQGPDADRELIAHGYRNAWVCQVGSAREHGSFGAFQDLVVSSYVQAIGTGGGAQQDALEVVYNAPGVGALRLAWQGAPTRDGHAIPTRGFLRYDNPYARVPFGHRRVELRHLGAALDLDWDALTRTGTGL